MRKLIFGSVLIICGLFFAQGNLMAADVPAGEVMAYSCFNCHGENGGGSDPIVKIAGLPKDLIIQKMKAFVNGDVPNTVMGRIAKGYTDAQIEALADYFSSK